MSDQQQQQPGSPRMADDPVFKRVGICHKCRHLRAPRTCTAFPGGIPPAILRGDHDHRKPYPGDKGITFQQRPISP